MDIAITGSSGLIGSALTRSLTSAGHRVLPLVRRTAGSDEIAWDPATGTIDRGGLEGVDAVVHLAGAGIGDRRWNEARKREILESRVRGTALLAETIAGLQRPPTTLLSGSAIGFYGDRGDEVLTEASAAGTGFLADVCRQWEAATAPASAAGVRVVYLRTGIVLSPVGGALKKQLPLFKIGLGGRFGKGTQWQSWISIDDEVAAITHLLTGPLGGAVNLTAPNPVTNATFAKTLGRVLKRPAALPIPSFGPALLFGRELVSEMLLAGQRVLPSKLEADGFRYTHPDLEGALRTLLDR